MGLVSPLRVSSVVYSVGIEIVVWAILVPLTLGRIAAGRATWRELRQRLGWEARPLTGGLLIHAVSAGEMRAASALVARAWQPRPLMLTTGTPAGMIVAEQLVASHDRVKAAAFLPWDRYAIRSWLGSVDAAAVVVTETELWPNLFLACRTRGCPLFVVNGQLHARDARRYRLAPWFFRPVVSCASWIGTEDAAGGDAFVAIGAAPQRVEVVGSLKVDAPSERRALPPFVGDCLHALPVLVAGSTHDPEESWLIGSIRRLRERFGLRLVIAPRDVRRRAAIARMAAKQDLSAATWSELKRAAPGAPLRWDVLVVDEFGWLPSLYARADIVFLGGTIAPVGGHNIAEPALLERPIVIGPHADRIASLVARLKDAGALVQLPANPTADSFVDACAGLLDQPERAVAMGRAAGRVCASLAGTVERYDRAIAERMA